jgi:DNA-binding MarR family transcriptional regulator
MRRSRAGFAGVPDRPATEADRELATRLHSATLHFLRRVRTVDRDLPIGPAQLSALSVVVFGGPRTLGALAAIEHVRPPTMTRIVAGLESAGLVVREPVPGDRRAARIRPTARGTRLMARGREQRVAAVLALLAGLSAPERATLRDAAELLGRLAHPRPAGGAPRSDPALGGARGID